MCGLVGMISGNKTRRNFNKYKPLASWFQQALFVDTLRGQDGTGIIAVSDGDMETFKKGVSGDSFIHEPFLLKTLKDIEDQDVLFGHNRAATKGGVSSTSAHPFTWNRPDGSSIAGVHNGTLRYWSHLKHFKDCDVDSDALYGEIATNGTEEALKVLQGAFALLWYDTDTELAYVVRNDERPLSFGWCKDHDSVLIASEVKMLEWLADRNNITLDRVEEVEAGKLYTFNPYSNSQTLEESLEVQEVDFYVPPKKHWTDTQSGGTNSSQMPLGTVVNLINMVWTKYTGVVDDRGVVTGTTASGFRYKVFGVMQEEFQKYIKKDMVAVVEGYGTDTYKSGGFLRLSKPTERTPATSLYKGPDGTYISLKEWNTVTADGCCCCGNQLERTDHDIIHWYSSTSGHDAICPTCAADFALSNAL